MSQETLEIVRLVLEIAGLLGLSFGGIFGVKKAALAKQLLGLINEHWEKNETFQNAAVSQGKTAAAKAIGKLITKVVNA